MGIGLFSHNEKAYRAALACMEKAGKAAVVHPTGTGKSFIAFKLIEEHPGAFVLWLSPGEDAFKTQTESLLRLAPGFSLANVSCFTYAQLLLLGEAALAELAARPPAYIVLDELHRCEAECWGKGVERLLAACPGAKLLGLFTTNAHCFYNQNDMANELFGGNIASEMPLGEAIVRGILPCPAYVSMVYQHDKELKHYQRQVDNLKGPGLQDANQKHLEALRRALEQADGLNEVFARQITHRRGKYIVFCSGLEHMREMMDHVSEWFGSIDPVCHVYSVYSGDPETSRAFVNFKEDESEHLKLLFCMDMLNEGVHVKGISGVILFRTTVSPTRYKQQIGRALTAGEGGTPLILDIVSNLKGLCSIAAVQEEMETAVRQLCANKEGNLVVAERLQVIEPVRDCRLLFEQLQSSLTGSWEQHFLAASEYAAEKGDLNVPKKYKTPEGLRLGSWLVTQRAVRAGGRGGSLTPRQIARLDGIGMIWGNRRELAWQRNYEAAKQYYKQHGDLMVPVAYKNEEGFALGLWLVNLRQQRVNRQRKNLLSPERIALLDEIGMVWSVISARWERNYAAAAEYYLFHGDLLAPASYRTPEGFALGAWLRALRKNRAGQGAGAPLTQEQIARLDAIGMYWGDCNENQWMKVYHEAKCYYEKHGHLEVPAGYTAPGGVKLRRWVCLQKKLKSGKTPGRTSGEGTLEPWQQKKLSTLGL